MTGTDPDWEGLPDTTEHRTVGPHRAWCYQDAEWCYPDALCWCCDQIRVPKQWRDEKIGDILAELRQRIEALPVLQVDVERIPHEAPRWRDAVLLDDVLGLFAADGSDHAADLARRLA